MSQAKRDLRVHKVAVRELRQGMPFVGVVTVVAPKGAPRARVVALAIEKVVEDGKRPASVAMTGTIQRPALGAVA